MLKTSTFPNVFTFHFRHCFNTFLVVIAAVIRPDAFASQSTLERIDLRSNQISNIEGGAFGGLTTPKEIYLAGNRLIQLNSDVFEVNQ